MKNKDDNQAPIVVAEVPDFGEAIIRIDKGVQQLLKSGLNRRGIAALLHDMTKMSRSDINVVIDGLEKLKTVYMSNQ